MHCAADLAGEELGEGPVVGVNRRLLWKMDGLHIKLGDSTGYNKTTAGSLPWGNRTASYDGQRLVSPPRRHILLV